MTVEQEISAFELVQRHANMLAASTLVPKEFQGNIANCAIGLNIAKRLGADPFMVIQNVDVIHGRPSFRATFLIAMVNASGRFTPLQFRLTGEGQTRACVAHCKDKATGEAIDGPEITMAMAKAEGWSTKAGSKWITMPELMLRYRAAAFFARLYAPDITLGMQTAEELYDAPAEPRVTTGRVVPELPARISNPYVEPEPQAAPEPEAAAPAQDDAAERAALIAEIRKAIKPTECSTPATFAPRCREAGLLEVGGQLAACPLEDLRTIAANAFDLAEGNYIPIN